MSEKTPWVGSDRKSRLPTNWTTLRNVVINRAQGVCEARMKNGTRCTDKGTDVDHIDRGDNHQLTNLQLLCRWHHNKKSSREGNDARVRLTERRPSEKHPGIVG